MTDQPALKQCFTIGHSNHPINRFIALLQEAAIDTIVDIRSTPFSRFSPQFNRQKLERSLKDNGIDYLFMGDRLGGRYTDPALLLPDGMVDYRNVQETELFKEGINRLAVLIASRRVIALMCAEKVPERCHRSVLITPALHAHGISVIHILADGSITSIG